MRTATFPRTNSALILYRVIIDSEDLVEKCLKGISRRCEVGDEMAQRDVDEKRPKPRPRPRPRKRRRKRRRRRRRIEEREKKE